MIQIQPILRERIRGLVEGKLPWPLMIVGGVGTGKTCAALSLLDHAGGLYFTAPGLCRWIIDAQHGRLCWRNEAHGGTLTEYEAWRWIERETLVVLDDLGGREQVKDFTYETIKELIDLRTGNPLIVTSNKQMDLLAEIYDDRVTSRLAAGTVVILEGEDRRLGNE